MVCCFLFFLLFRGLKTTSQKSSGNLTKQEMMQVCKRRTGDDVEVTGREKLKGVGFDRYPTIDFDWPHNDLVMYTKK